MKKHLIMLAALALVCSCAGNKNNEAAAQADSEVAIPDSLALHGMWKLTSYTIDSLTTEFADTADYRLVIDQTADTYSINTGCNYIAGAFSLAGDTLRLHPGLVTEMACDDMTVEQNMLRMVNDEEAYGCAMATPSPTLLHRLAPLCSCVRLMRNNNHI